MIFKAVNLVVCMMYLAFGILGSAGIGKTMVGDVYLFSLKLDYDI